MTDLSIATLFFLLLPFLLSLAGRAATPKVLCLVTSVLALLLSVEPWRAVLPWTDRHGDRGDFRSRKNSSAARRRRAASEVSAALDAGESLPV